MSLLTRLDQAQTSSLLVGLVPVRGRDIFYFVDIHICPACLVGRSSNTAVFQAQRSAGSGVETCGNKTTCETISDVMAERR